jgi:hypothetical protein
MPYEQKTRQKPQLPEDDYTVVARLTAFTDIPYNQAHASFLQDSLHLQDHEIELNDDNLYVALRVGRLADEAVWQEAAYSLSRGLARLAIDPDIVALADQTKMIDRGRKLSDSFPYLMSDVTVDLCNELADLRTQQVEIFDFDMELQHLQEH